MAFFINTDSFKIGIDVVEKQFQWRQKEYMDNRQKTIKNALKKLGSKHIHTDKFKIEHWSISNDFYLFLQLNLTNRNYFETEI